MKKKLTLSEWAKQKGMHYTSAHRKYKAGQLPSAYTIDGRIFVDIDICEHCGAISDVNHK